MGAYRFPDASVTGGAGMAGAALAAVFLAAGEDDLGGSIPRSMGAVTKLGVGYSLSPRSMVTGAGMVCVVVTGGFFTGDFAAVAEETVGLDAV